MKKTIPARMADQPADYRRLGLAPGAPALWEDGVRTQGHKGEFEWWYFDAKLEGGASLVVVFFTTPFVSTREGYEPRVTFDLTYPDGTKLHDAQEVAPGRASFRKDRCHAQIGDSVFEGDLHAYTIRFCGEAVQAEIRLTGNVPAWRPASGQIFFGETDYFAWMPAVPEGHVEARVTAAGKTETFTGTGYHDHNWGNVAMFKLMHHWYWGRAKVGEYQVISSYITARKKYGYEHFPVFMLAKGGELLGDDPARLRYTQQDPAFDEETGKHYYKTLRYDYDAGAQQYHITYRMQTHLEKNRMMGGTGAKAALMKVGMKLMGLAPSYDRMSGQVTLERLENGRVVETVTAPALWELMYFGKDADV